MHLFSLSFRSDGALENNSVIMMGSASIQNESVGLLQDIKILSKF